MLDTSNASGSKQSERSLLDSLKDSASSFLLANTTGVRAELAWAAFAPQVHPAYRDFYFFRTASVNMGSANNKAYAVFIGFNQDWYLAPSIKLDFDNVSILRLLETQ